LPQALVSGADDDHAGDATARQTAVVLGDADARVLYLAGACFAPELKPGLEDHPQSGSAYGVAEALQAAIGIDRYLPVDVEGAGLDVLLVFASLGEAQVLADYGLSDSEAIVYLSDVDFLARVLDTSPRWECQLKGMNPPGGNTKFEVRKES
jgi:hypothetical protein